VLTLCLGEALVDLVCEHPADSLAEATSFAPHFGGAVANVSVVAARHGGAMALAGGAGDDDWGQWLADRLAQEGVDLRWFRLVAEAPTPVAFVTVDGTGEPSFQIYGDAIETLVEGVGPLLGDAVESCDALVITSNTLVGEAEHAVTMDARQRAMDLGHPVVFDPNFRLHRWPHPGRAASAARECLPGAFLVKCNLSEARLLTGEHDPEAAASGLLAAGARHVVVTLGADGAILRGVMRLDVPGVGAEVVDATGAGDALLGVLLARLSATAFYDAAIAAALPEAVVAAARTTEHWGAVG
jgi:fructokinase